MRCYSGTVDKRNGAQVAKFQVRDWHFAFAPGSRRSDALGPRIGVSSAEPFLYRSDRTRQLHSAGTVLSVHCHLLPSMVPRIAAGTVGAATSHADASAAKTGRSEQL